MSGPLVCAVHEIHRGEPCIGLSPPRTDRAAAGIARHWRPYLLGSGRPVRPQNPQRPLALRVRVPSRVLHSDVRRTRRRLAPALSLLLAACASLARNDAPVDAVAGEWVDVSKSTQIDTIGAGGGSVQPRTVPPERPSVATHARAVAPGYVEGGSRLQRDRSSHCTTPWSVATIVQLRLARLLQLSVPPSVLPC